jgi:HSP90 family molecular chaperone
LLRFTTTKSEEKDISLDKYLDRMQESQESIYYMSGDNMEVMKKAPALQVFKKKDIEVLMLSDHLDEPCIQKLADYEGKKFVSIQKADVKLDETEEEKKKFTKLKDMYKPLTDWWKESLTDLTEKGAMKDAGIKIEKVELSKRLTDSPVVVVTSQFGHSAQQEKIMKAQAFQNKDQISQMSGRKTLEVNANHPVIVDLLSKIKADKSDAAALDSAQVLFQTALIESGYEIADPSALVNRVYRLMSKELGVDPDAPVKEVEVPEEEEEAEEEDKAALDTAQVLFQTALIESGYEIADPSALVNRVYRLMSKELGVDPDAPIKEVEVPEEEEEAEEDDKDDGKEDDGDEEDEKEEKPKEEL